MKKINIVLSILLAFLLLSSCADVFPPKGEEISGENAANSSGIATEKAVEEPPYYIYDTRTIPESENYYSLNKTNLEEKITISICGKEFTLTHDGILDFDGWYSVRANTDTPISGRLSTLFSIIFEEKDTNVIRCISI